MTDLLANYADWIVGVTAALVIVASIARKVQAKIVRVATKANAMAETLLGRDEIRHPETGDLLVESTPPLGMRFARMEEAIVKMADTNDTVKTLAVQVTHLTQRFDSHIEDCKPTTPAPVVINQTVAEQPK